MIITRTKERINKTGEIFTPPHLVEEMLDTLPQELFKDPDKTFLDPSCGDGNFLVAVLSRKVQNGSTPLQALRTTFGVELMADNVQECKRRLKEITIKALIDSGVSSEVLDKALPVIDRILDNNIQCHDALTFDYDKWEMVKKKQ